MTWRAKMSRPVSLRPRLNIALVRRRSRNYNNSVMSTKRWAVFIFVVMGAIGVAGSRSFVWAQQAAIPAPPSSVVAQTLDKISAQTGPTSASGMTGTITAASGAVKVRRVKALFWENAKVGQEIAEGDHIRTGRDGQVKIEFADGNTMYIKKNSVVIVEALARDGDTGKYDAVFKTTRARIKAQIDEKKDLNTFEIRTPVVVCGVRGTVLYLTAGPGFADVFVERGNVFLRSPVSGEERELPQGMATQADRSGQIAPPKPPSPEMLAQMQEGWEPKPPPPPGTQDKPPLPPPLPVLDLLGKLDERIETQETTKADYVGQADNDNDGIADSDDPDDDNDFLTDFQELTTYLTDPLRRDTDGDGLTDWEEFRTQFSDAHLVNTDGDSANDLNDVDPNDPTIFETRDLMRDTRYNEIAAEPGLRAEISLMLADAAERQRDYLMDKMSDAQTHKVMQDHAGGWVRLEQHIFRPKPNTVTLCSFTYRTSAQLTYFHWDTTFNANLDNLTSTQIKNLPWERYLSPAPNYGLTPPPIYPTQMRIEFERSGNTDNLREVRDFSAPTFATSWTQTVTPVVAYNGGAYNPVVYTPLAPGNPTSFDYSTGAGTATFTVYAINDTGGLFGGPYTFGSIWDVLGCNLPGFQNIGPHTIEVEVVFFGNTWSYLYVPLRDMMWRGVPPLWHEEKKW